MLGLICFLVAQAAPATVEHKVVFNLVEREPEILHVERVPAGKPLSLVLTLAAPGARYRVTTGAGPERWLEVLDAKALGAPFASRPDCKPQLAALAELAGLGEEAAAYNKRGQQYTIIRGLGDPSVGAKLLESLRPWFEGWTALSGTTLTQSGSVEIGIERFGLTGASAQRSWRVRLATASGPAWTYPTETAWLVNRTAHDIAEMLLFAKSPAALQSDSLKVTAEEQAPKSGRFAVRISLGGDPPLVSQTLDVSKGVWMPSSYLQLARNTAKNLGVSASTNAANEVSILEPLTDPRVQVVERENRRVSDWLAREPASAKAHAQAGLLLATLGLREAAGAFSDVRPILCRIAAHLALARAFDGEPSASEAFAQIALDVLARRQREAKAALDQLGPRAQLPGGPAWARSLALWTTNDWRALEKPVTATLLERIAYARALNISLGGLHTLAFLASRNSEAIPDWGRIAMNRQMSPQEAEAYVPKAIALELAEARAVYRLHFDATAESSRLGQALNESDAAAIPREASEKLRPWVISWGTWARSYQRHLLSALVQSRAHGLDDEPLLKSLDLNPLSQVLLARGNQVCGMASSFWERSPERLSAFVWERLVNICGASGFQASVAVYEKWFAAATPPGTAYDASNRIALFGIEDRTALQALRVIAPYDKRISKALSRSAGTAADIEAAYGALLQYDIESMGVRADFASLDVDQYLRVFGKACEWDAGSCARLGFYLASRDRPVEAAAAYQRAVDHSLDRSRPPDHVKWLVDYYMTNSRSDDALKVGREIAKTGSPEALELVAELLERLARYREAEEYYARLGTPPSAKLAWFQERWVARLGRSCDGGNEKGVEAVFGGPPSRARLEEFSGTPLRGAYVLSPGKLKSLGLKEGAVIVALDGYRITSPVEFACVAQFASGEAKAIVWRSGGQYSTVSGDLRDIGPEGRLTSFRR